MRSLPKKDSTLEDYLQWDRKKYKKREKGIIRVFNTPMQFSDIEVYVFYLKAK